MKHYRGNGTPSDAEPQPAKNIKILLNAQVGRGVRMARAVFQRLGTYESIEKVTPLNRRSGLTSKETVSRARAARLTGPTG